MQEGVITLLTWTLLLLTAAVVSVVAVAAVVMPLPRKAEGG